MASQINMIKVSSSNIYAIGYHEGSKALVIHFKNNRFFLYQDVDKGEFEALRNAESVGKYFHSTIRRNYMGKPVDEKEIHSIVEGRA